MEDFLIQTKQALSIVDTPTIKDGEIKMLIEARNS